MVADGDYAFSRDAGMQGILNGDAGEDQASLSSFDNMSID